MCLKVVTSFLIWTSLISFSCLSKLSRPSDTTQSSSESGHPYIVLILRGEALTMELELVVGFVGALWQTEEAPLYYTYILSFPRLNQECMLDFTKCFFCVCWYRKYSGHWLERVQTQERPLPSLKERRGGRNPVLWKEPVFRSCAHPASALCFCPWLAFLEFRAWPMGSKAVLFPLHQIV